jgi:RNA polymerase sigma-70 factor (ECF subfamily)
VTRSGGATLEAIERVYRRDGARFLHVATAIVGDLEVASDAVQDAFANAVRHRAGFRGEGPLEAWLWRMVVHSARKERGRANRRPLPVGAVEAALTNGGAVASDDIRVGVAALPERQRHALFLRYYADLDYAAIAVVLGVSIGTVGSTLAAAHAALRPLIKEKSHDR